MHDVIEKLLILQDRDRQILKIQERLSRIAPERESSTPAPAPPSRDWTRQSSAGEEVPLNRRKKLELEVDSKKQAIEKSFPPAISKPRKTKKMSPWRQQIENCRGDITGLEDRQLELMEQADLAAKELLAATRDSQNVKTTIGQQLKDLDEREAN